MNTIANVSDNVSSFARGQRVCVQWESEGEAFATVNAVYYWGDVATLVVTYDEAHFERRADKFGGAYRNLLVNDANRWSAPFKMV